MGLLWFVLVCCGGVRWLCELVVCAVLCVRVDGVRVCVLVVLVFMGLCVRVCVVLCCMWWCGVGVHGGRPLVATQMTILMDVKQISSTTFTMPLFWISAVSS